MKKSLLIVGLCLMLSFSFNANHKLKGMWVFEKTESKLKEVYDQSQAEIDTENLISNYFKNNYLLFENDKFNAVLGARNGIYSNGNWNYNEADSTITLTSDKNKITLKVTFISLPKLSLTSKV